MSRLLPASLREPSKLQVCHLDDADTRASLIQFCGLIGSCRGPNGKMKMIQNNLGGHLTITSSSSRILAAMSFSHPVLRIIVGSTQNHLGNYKDGGLLVCHLCLLLLKSSLVQTWNKRLVVAVYESCLSKMEEYFTSADCACKFDITVSSIEEMMSFLHCILVSKPLCGLHDEGLDHLSKTILKSFLYSVPEDTEKTYFSDRIYIQCMSDNALSDTRFEKGILMPCPELSSFFKQNVELKKSVDSFENQKVKVALVNVSMSGDAEEMLDVNYEAGDSLDVNENMLSVMLKTCERLVESGVGMVLSQKVVHPRIKAYLRSSSVFFVDRIGALLMPYLRDLTGAAYISSVYMTDFDTDTFGWVDDATHCVVSGKSYIHLINNDSPVVSIILCSPGEEVCNELKCVCSAALLSLKRLVQSGSVVCGGGCWQTHIASFLRSQTDSISKAVNFMPSQLLEIVGTFANCLEKTATSLSHDKEIHMIDESRHHLWKIPGTFGQSSETRETHVRCSCGLLSTDNLDRLKYLGQSVLEKSGSDSECSSSLSVEKGPQIIDSLAVVMGAVQTAVYTANSILTTSQFICDDS